MLPVIILSGGCGKRFSENDNEIPKQYRTLNGKPVIYWSLIQYENNPFITDIFIVAEQKWHNFILKIIHDNNINKFRDFALPGICRQESAWNGMKKVSIYMNENDIVLFQDSARPLVSQKMISSCISACRNYDGAVIGNKEIEGVCRCDRNELITDFVNDGIFNIQSPDAYIWGRYYRINEHASMTEMIESRGCMHIATAHGLRIKVLLLGGICNPKITFRSDIIWVSYILSIYNKENI